MGLRKNSIKDMLKAEQKENSPVASYKSKSPKKYK